MTASNATINDGLLYTYFAVVVSGINFVGLMGNALLLYIFISDKYFRKITYYLMLICVISDGISNIFSLISTGLLLGKHGTQSYTMLIVCSISGVVVYISYGVSIMNLCLISIDRYFAFVKPLNMFYRVYRKKIVIIVEILIWIISASITIPDIAFIQAPDDDKFICDYPNVTISISIYLVSYTVVYYVLPSMVITIAYWRIIIFQRNYVRPGQTIKQLKYEQASKRKLIKSLISISLSYVLLTFPYFVVLLSFGVTRTNLLQVREKSSVLFAICVLAVASTSNITVINPFLYLKFDGNIRKNFKEILKCCHKGDHKRI
ncbi:Neuropeptide SIFamide receptor [Trichoplax sp. H2]|nr:Neuropeptide SIFamide receptor [Trichoplax sp. H2]|eukprot:RDD39730.1 Neuropeptide SIFamide receptor [Trichoplax sp. H2]